MHTWISLSDINLSTTPPINGPAKLVPCQNSGRSLVFKSSNLSRHLINPNKTTSEFFAIPISLPLELYLLIQPFHNPLLDKSRNITLPDISACALVRKASNYQRENWSTNDKNLKSKMLFRTAVTNRLTHSLFICIENAYFSK